MPEQGWHRGVGWQQLWPVVELRSGSRAKVGPNKVASGKGSENSGFLFQEGTSGQQPGLGKV